MISSNPLVVPVNIIALFLPGKGYGSNTMVIFIYYLRKNMFKYFLFRTNRLSKKKILSFFRPNMKVCIILRNHPEYKQYNI